MGDNYKYNPCPHCITVGWTNRREREKHNKEEHSERSPYECTHCKVRFKNKFYFKWHEQEKHSGSTNNVNIY